MAEEASTSQRTFWPRLSRVLTALAAVAGGLLAIVGAVTLLRGWYDDTIGQDSQLYRRLEKLTADSQVDYFTEVLGAPRLKNPTTTWDRYVYVHDKYYVQAVTNKDGKVMFFSVTTRRADFKPQFGFRGAFTKGGSQVRSFRLGQVHYAELSDSGPKPHGIAAMSGAHTGYGEVFYFGKPSQYQAYVFANSEVGYLGGRLPSRIGQIVFENRGMLGRGWFADDRRVRATIDDPGMVSLLGDSEISAERRTFAPNTYGVISGSVMLDPDLEPYDFLNYLLGPTATEVRGLALE